MFICFALCLGTNILILATHLPSDPDPAKVLQASSVSTETSGVVFCRFEVLWFFSNLFVYGMHLALVETFLFVYLIRDFVGADSTLFGLSVAIMCLFELPVFYHIQTAISRFSLTTLLSVCHAIFALRVFAYSVLPSEHPWIVLVIEPLHGITAAAMWSCSVEFGRRLAPDGSKARMQALASGVYYRAASGAGALLWGAMTRPPPVGYGFRPMYFTAGCTILLWSAFWNIGWWLRGPGARSISAPPCLAARAP
mmetsp:Transcript_107395/g.342322  ORF Transcript_107395/g.342322 Transcript_107395/m.342322 type:complete len:253 (+) Transcript_107395:154-912(+)